MAEIVNAIMECRDDGLFLIQLQVNTDQQIELEEHICSPERLVEIQAKEHLSLDLVNAELDTPCLEQLKVICPESMRELRPSLFLEDLWPRDQFTIHMDTSK